MNRVIKTAILSAAIAATTLAMSPAANARDWHHRHRHHHGSHGGDAVAAGVLGLAAGAIIGGALASRPDYYEPDYVVRRDPYPRPVRHYYPAQAAYDDYAIEPWTRAWYSYCSDRYRTFNARTGTFTGYDGQQHFCAAN